MSDVTSGPSSTQPKRPSGGSAPSGAPAADGGGERRRLAQAPGERIAASKGSAGSGSAGSGSAGSGSAGSGSGSRSGAAGRPALVPIMLGLFIADLGAVVFFVLGLADLGIGLVAVAGFFGWLAALALVWRGRDAAVADPRARGAVAGFLGAWVVLAGMLIDWVYALLIGGVLGPLDYWAQRYGLTAVLALLAGALIAAYRAR